jgi:hypothetical protein
MSAFLVTPEHISEIVKYAQKKEFRYAYNSFTKKQIDCDPKNMVKLLAQANIDSLVNRYGDYRTCYVDFVNECLDSFSTLGRADLGSDGIINHARLITGMRPMLTGCTFILKIGLLKKWLQTQVSIGLMIKVG